MRYTLIQNFQNRGYSYYHQVATGHLYWGIFFTQSAAVFSFLDHRCPAIYAESFHMHQSLLVIVLSVRGAATGEKSLMCVGNRSLQHQYCCLHIKLALLQHFHCHFFPLSLQLGAETET